MPVRKITKAYRAPKNTSTTYQRRWAEHINISAMKKTISTPIYHNAQIFNKPRMDTRHATKQTGL